jgi:hypothetical protein
MSNTKKNSEPSTTDFNGRDEFGRFVKGNRAAKGNPFAKKVARLRAALLGAITPADMRTIIKKLIKQARSGDLAAAREVFDRAVGRPQELDFIEKLENLERMLDEIAGQTQSDRTESSRH